MEQSMKVADFQLLDNYISEFNLKISNKIPPTEEVETDGRIGFGIVSINEKEMIGQVELSYEIDVKQKNSEVGKINIVMNALFQGSPKMKLELFEEMLKINGATTLSHLCRAYILSVTAQSGMPPIILPLMNFEAFFENAEKEK